jgi:two-component system, sensor histidine kinase ChiS
LTRRAAHYRVTSSEEIAKVGRPFVSRLFLFLWLFCSFFFSHPAVAAHHSAYFSFRHIAQDQLAGIGYINTISQDKTGFMWFGGANGIARYDGYDITIFRHIEQDKKSLSHSYINDILVADKKGDLWIATRSGLNYFDASQQRFFHWYIKSIQTPEVESVDVLAMAYKDEHTLWLATRDGLVEFDIETHDIRHRKILPLEKSNSQFIWSIAYDERGYLWLGTQSAGVIRWNPVTEEATQYTQSIQSTQSDSQQFFDIRRVYQDKHQAIWAASYDAGLFKWNPAADVFEKVVHAKNEKSATVWSVLEDSLGNLWVGDGSAVYHRPLGGIEFTRFVYDERDPESPGNYVVNELYEDASGGIWLGYFPSGVDMIDRQASVFRNYRHDSTNVNSLTDGGVLSSAKDAKENLWIGTGYGLNYFEKKREKFTRYEFNTPQTKGLTGNTILSAVLDTKNQLWLGIWSGGLNRLNIASGEFTHYLPNPDNPDSIMGKEAWSVIVDKKGFVWAATEEGINRLDPETGRFRRYLPNPKQMDGDKVLYSRAIYEDKQGRIWAGTIRGLYLIDPDTGEFTRYQHRVGDKKSLSMDYVYSIYEDSRGNFWLGTDGGGINKMDRDTGEFRAYTTRDGLSDDVVVGIVEDQQGFLWLGTQKGISRFNPATVEFRNFDKRHGLSDNLFNRNSPVLFNSGEIFFGNSKGFVIFDPLSIKTNPHVASVVFTDLLVFNKKVLPGEKNSPLTQSIGHTSSLQLSHRDTVFTLEFSALSYEMSEENRYMYKLNGFDTDWIQAGNRHSVTYTNLDPGQYVFEVRASNNDDVWNSESTKLAIEIVPAWWATWWAYSIYAVAIAVFLLSIWRTQKMRLYFERQRVEQERSLVRRLQEIDKLKDEFLANTSHELRTPLNGIIGLAESLKDGVEGEIPEAVRHSLGLIVTSGRRLSTLVDDILDFAKLRNKGLTLHKKVVDLSVLIDVVISLIRPLIGDKKIILENCVSDDFPGVIADEDRLLQILYNLIGNAVKFTEQGYVRINSQIAENNLAIYIHDTGLGIAEEKLSEIFEAFQQIDGDIERRYGGTGLGLTITKQLVELHGGVLSVESTPGKGSTFCFTLPYTKDLQKPEASRSLELLRNTANLIQAEHNHLLHIDDLPYLQNQGEHILVVDDDALNRKVLVNYLSFRDYRVSEAGSGEEAIAIVEQAKDVDLVLLDIMMPKLSGYETCKRLRMAYPTHELPIIFLTARNQTNDLVMGFDVGGNDYLTKPIEKEELLARVATHLQLLDATRHLDKKVAERTQELNKTNEGLRLAQQRLHDAYIKIEEASLTDHLTGLHNRRFLTKSIVSDIALVDRSYQNGLQTNPIPAAIPDQDVVFVMLDVDFFKEVNDAFGHAAGDKVLEQLSRLLEKNLRDSDYLIRWGGEEFLIVLRFCSRQEVIDMIERIRKSVADHIFDLGNNRQIQKTCSIGFAAYPFYFHAPIALTWEQVVDTADRALYIAKRSGRNCWVGISASDDLHQTPINPAIQTNLPVLFALNQLKISSSLLRELLVVDAKVH